MSEDEIPYLTDYTSRRKRDTHDLASHAFTRKRKRLALERHIELLDAHHDLVHIEDV